MRSAIASEILGKYMMLSRIVKFNIFNVLNKTNWAKIRELPNFPENYECLPSSDSTSLNVSLGRSLVTCIDPTPSFHILNVEQKSNSAHEFVLFESILD